mmetsp:Transcript_10387/g.63364  ORF Transcript_10387/g.63364 Transcript_10387/m.63364 type:complete len:374 (-) Transcript_10387:4055-5176(-)
MQPGRKRSLGLRLLGHAARQRGHSHAVEILRWRVHGGRAPALGIVRVERCHARTHGRTYENGAINGAQRRSKGTKAGRTQTTSTCNVRVHSLFSRFLRSRRTMVRIRRGKGLDPCFPLLHVQRRCEDHVSLDGLRSSFHLLHQRVVAEDPACAGELATRLVQTHHRAYDGAFHDVCPFADGGERFSFGPGVHHFHQSIIQALKHVVFWRQEHACILLQPSNLQCQAGASFLRLDQLQRQLWLQLGLLLEHQGRQEGHRLRRTQRGQHPPQYQLSGQQLIPGVDLASHPTLQLDRSVLVNVMQGAKHLHALLELRRLLQVLVRQEIAELLQLLVQTLTFFHQGQLFLQARAPMATVGDDGLLQPRLLHVSLRIF